MEIKHMESIFKDPIIEQPPTEKELLVKSPDGVYHLAYYRITYNIFTCQSKHESISGWKYIVIGEL